MGEKSKLKRQFQTNYPPLLALVLFVPYLMQIRKIDHIVDFFELPILAAILERQGPSWIILELNDGTLESDRAGSAVAGNIFLRLVLGDGNLGGFLVRVDQSSRDPRS